MDSTTAPPAPGATVLTRALCLLILALMAAAAGYGATIALRYFRQSWWGHLCIDVRVGSAFHRAPPSGRCS